MTTSIRESSDKTETGQAAAGHAQGLASEMLLQLQTSLDTGRLTAIIRNQINRLVPVDALVYVNEEESLRLTQGTPATHSCGYRLVTRDEYLGELIFQRNHSFSDRELQGIESLLPLVLAPLRNSLQFRRAVQASLRDPVSGARNRQQLDELLPREIELAKRHNRPLSALLIEIDEWERIHRQTGPGQADSLIRQFVQGIASFSRDTDLLFQLDSETLLLLLHETGQKAATTLARRLRQHCQETAYELSDGRIQLSVSLGLVCLTGTDNQQSLLDRGYKALQRSRGRTAGHG